jgi:hypothetical protein
MNPRVPITQSSSFIAWVEATSSDLWIPFNEQPASRPVQRCSTTPLRGDALLAVMHDGIGRNVR